MKKLLAKYASAVLLSWATLFVATLKLWIGSPEAPKELLDK